MPTVTRAVCAVRDLAMEAFAQPMFVPTPAVAVRGFINEARRAESAIRQNPEDYELYHIAEYDESSGTFRNLDKPELLMRAVNVPDNRDSSS